MAAGTKRHNQKGATFMSENIPNTVQASQLHYTSCEFGMSGHAGFQTRAMSASIDAQQKTAIEQLAVYQPPTDLRRSAVGNTPQNITPLEDFPVAWRHLHLPDGSLAITRSAYTGEDYTGREGNYFGHGLLFERLPQGLWPIDLYEHQQWKLNLPEEEDCKQDSYDLPPLNIAIDTKAYNFSVLQEFLTDTDQAEKILSEMIQAVLLKAKTSRTLIIRDPMASNGVFWLACLQKCFPTTVQQHLSCSSYQYDPRSCAAINVIYGQTDLNLDENARKFQFYVFDFVDHQFSDIDSTDPFYAQIIAKWMVNEPHTIQAFHQLADLFDINELNDALTPLVHLFMLKQQNNVTLHVDDLMNIVELVNNHARQDHLAQIVGILSDHQSLLASVTAIDMLEKVTLFFINSYKISASQTIRDMIVAQLSRLTILSVTSTGVETQLVTTLRQKAAQADNDISHLTAQNFLSEANMAAQAKKLNGLSSEQMIVLVSITVEFIELLNPDIAPLDSPQWHDFICVVISKRGQQMDDVDWLFSPFATDPASTAKIILMVCEKLPQLCACGVLSKSESDTALGAFTQYLFKRFDKNPQDWFTLVNQLKSNQHSWDLLQRHWHLGLDNSRKKIDYYQDYADAVMANETDYQKAYLNPFANSCWNKLNDKQRFEMAINWLRSGHLEDLERPMVEKVVQCANGGIQFTAKHSVSDEIIRFLPALIAQHNITLNKPNKLRLRQVIQTQGSFAQHALDEVSTALQGCDKPTYKSFINIYLPILFESFDHQEQHGDIIGHLYIRQFNDVFVSTYQSNLSIDKNANIGSDCEVFLAFWLFLETVHPFYRQCRDVQSELITVLVAKLAKHKDRALAQIVKNFKSKADLNQRQQGLLDDVMRQVEDKKNTFLRKVGRHSVAGAKAVASMAKSGINKLYNKVRN